MVIDACMIMYIVYILYSVLWVFTLFVGDFNCFIHNLILVLKFWLAIANQKVICTCFKCFELEIVLKYSKPHNL